MNTPPAKIEDRDIAQLTAVWDGVGMRYAALAEDNSIWEFTPFPRGKGRWELITDIPLPRQG